MPDDERATLTVAEACALAPCKRDTLYRAIAAGEIPAFALGVTKLRRSDVLAWAESRRVQPKVRGNAKPKAAAKRPRRRKLLHVI